MKSLLELALEDILPESLTRDEHVKQIAACLDPALRLASHDTRLALVLSRIDELPEPVVDALAAQLHVDLYSSAASLAIKRRLVRNSLPWHRKKGTRWAVTSALAAYGFKADITEWWQTAVPVAPHIFSVLGYCEDAPENLDYLGPDTEAILRGVVEQAKPARSSLIVLKASPPMPEEFRNHTCVWDVCTWEHARHDEFKHAFDVARQWPAWLVLACLIVRGMELQYVRADCYDAVRWNEIVYSGVRDEIGRTMLRGLACRAELNFFEYYGIKNPARLDWLSDERWNSDAKRTWCGHELDNLFTQIWDVGRYDEDAADSHAKPVTMYVDGFLFSVFSKPVGVHAARCWDRDRWDGVELLEYVFALDEFGFDLSGWSSRAIALAMELKIKLASVSASREIVRAAECVYGRVKLSSGRVIEMAGAVDLDDDDGDLTTRNVVRWRFKNKPWPHSTWLIKKALSTGNLGLDINFASEVSFISERWRYEAKIWPHKVWSEKYNAMTPESFNFKSI